jgi:hypothetical protein
VWRLLLLFPLKVSSFIELLLTSYNADNLTIRN